MCIVIDVNTLAAVFNHDSKNHAEFSPVKKWIEEGRGFLVFGGTRYKSELTKTFRYLRFVRQMLDGGQAVSIQDSIVDKIEEEIQKKTEGTKCNDQHIIALLIAARCPLFCSCDSRSFEFIKNRSLYPKHMPRVRISSSSKNSNLLSITSTTPLKNVKYFSQLP